MDTAIINTNLITFRGDGLGIIDDGAVSFSDGKIDFVGKTGDLDRSDIERTIDGRKHVTMPGLVNAHTHTTSTILRGGAQDVPEIEWMNKAIGPFWKHLEKEDKILGSKLGVIEGLRSGITTFGEYTTDVGTLIKKVYNPFNVRVAATETINEVVSKRDDMGPREVYELNGGKGKKTLKKVDELHDKYKSSNLVEIFYGPQALDMISIDTLKEVKKHANKRKAKVHMHVAQGERESLQIKERFGKNNTTVKTLKELNILDDDLIAVHCHDTTQNEKVMMVEKGVDMVGCPSSIAMIDGIVAPVLEFMKLGGSVGLGTDQAPGPGTHNMFREMRTASILTKTRYKDPTRLPAWEILKVGCLGGARVLGLENKVGSLEVGKDADIITVDLSNVNLTPSVREPFHNFIPNLVYSTTGFEVDNVIINGDNIMKDGEFVKIDEMRIIERAQKRAESLFKDVSVDWKDAGSYLVDIARQDFI
ncbi:MAG: amidohydrolase family protein [Candidatus Saliniplasma sp.]